MDHDLIYAKTTSGEAAMLQRTRTMQRNVRMVLILVDSQSSVADLCLKTGNPQLTENALLELEKGGFIEPRGDVDSMWAEGAKVAQVVRAAASSHRKDLLARSVSAPSALAEPSASDAAVSADAAVKTSLSGDLSISETPLALAQAEPAAFPVCAEAETRTVAGAQSSHSKGAAASFVEHVKALFTKQNSNIDKAQRVSLGSSKPPPSSEGRHEGESNSRLAELRQTVAPSTLATGDEVVLLKPTRRAQAESMSWPTVVVLAIAGAFGLLFVAVLLFPFNNYLPELDAAISNACGRPAKVGAVRLNVYPRPTIVLGDVRIGADRDEIRIDEVRLQPAIGTLMAAKIIFREAIVSGVVLPVEVIAGLPRVFVALSSPSARFGVDHLGLEKLTITFSALSLSNMDGDAGLSADGLLESLRLSSADRRLSLVATPVGQGLDIVLEGYAWRPVSGSAFLLDSVNLNAFADNGVLTIKNMALRIFDGVIEGGAVLRANQPLSIDGDLSFKRVNATRLGEAIGLGQQFSGETSGKMRFSTKGDAWASVFSAVNAEGDFAMQRGSIRGIDLVEAARSVSRNPVQGGATPFENLSGTIKLTPTRYQFSALVLNSGLMQSTGFFDVSSELMVSGTMELKIRGTANQTRVPISIGGPLKSPVVQVGRGGSL